MQPKLAVRMLAATLLSIAAWLALGCGDDGPANPPGGSPATLSNAWGGVWEIRFTFRHCTTDSLFMEVTVVDSFCAGGVAVTELGLRDFGFIACPNVMVSVAGNSISASCSVTEPNAECTVTQSFTVNGTANSNGTLTGNGQIVIDVSPDDRDCGEDLCYNIEVAGERTSTDQSWCTASIAFDGRGNRIGSQVGAALRERR
jgi:hypothetical protein